MKWKKAFFFNYDASNRKNSHFNFIFILTASLESARRSASDANYITTDEERLGRGKRPHILCSRYGSSDEECEEAQPRNSKTKTKSMFELLDILIYCFNIII